MLSLCISSKLGVIRLNIDIVTITNWLFKGWNWLYDITLIAVVIGSLYAYADTIDRKHILAGKIIQSVITGVVGGLSFSIFAVLTAIPLGLLFNPSFYTEMNKHKAVGAFLFLELLFTSTKPSVLLNALPKLFIYFSVLGLLLGLGIGIVSAFIPGPGYTRKNSSSDPDIIRVRIFWDNVIGWCLLGIVIGFSFGLNFGVVVGAMSGFFLAPMGFYLKLNPKQPQFSSQQPLKRFHLFSWRTLAFWVIIISTLILLLVYMIKSVFIDSSLSLTTKIFLFVVLLVFFGFLELQGTQLATKQKPKASTLKKRPNTNTYDKGKYLSLDYRRVTKALTTGLICGILLYGMLYGIPVSFFFEKALGLGIGFIVEGIFCLIGLGVGAALGCIFVYIYVLGPILAYKISLLPETRIKKIAAGLAIFSGIAGILLGRFFPPTM